MQEKYRYAKQKRVICSAQFSVMCVNAVEADEKIKYEAENVHGDRYCSKLKLSLLSRFDTTHSSSF